MKNYRSLLTVLLIVMLLLGACTLGNGSTTPTPALNPDQPVTSGDTPEPVLPTDEPVTGDIIGQAAVDSVEILILESFPVQVNAVIRGNLPDGCTQVDQVVTALEGNTFRVGVTTVRQAELVCTEALMPYEKIIPLDVEGLLAGDYLVDVNGVQGAFSLAVDNVAIEEPPVVTIGQIKGLVWHDECAVAGEGSAPANPSAGCVALPDGGYQANGTFEAGEPGIDGIEVKLYNGACPSNDLVASTITASGGRFEFDANVPGTYCVSVDSLANPNSAILIPGEWTAPAANGMVTVAMGETDLISEVSFGWDFQFLPVPEAANDPVCEVGGTFEEDITVPDDTEFAAGAVFEKTWRFKNTGTCTWNTKYQLVYEKGDRMSGEGPIPFPKSVAPGESMDISVSLTAPGTTGTYKGFWILQDDEGKQIPLGKNKNGFFFVQIVVVEAVSKLNLGAADWTDNFNNSANWFLIDSKNTKFEVKDGNMVMTAITTGGGENWGLSNQPALEDFYIEAKFRTGDKCEGIDRYGLLLRAPDTDSGYVLGISCSGSIRLYKWDGAYNPLQEWKSSGSIFKGPQKENVIGFWAKGNNLKIYANDNLVAEFTDNKFDKGQFGLLIGSTNTANFKVFVDYIKYWKLD